MNSKYDVIVVGAGPAGSALAYYLGLKGYRVAVYDMAPKPGSRPCGKLVPVHIEKYLKIPSEHIVAVVKGYRVYLDGKLVGENYGKTLGYVVDKSSLLQYLLEQADFKPKTYVDPSRVTGWREALAIATGVYYWGSRGDKILAVQGYYKVKGLEEDVVEIWFDSSLVGYYWVFPWDKGLAEIGVGGYASYSELRRRLEEFAKQFKAELAGYIAGSPIYVGGVETSSLKTRTVRLGEAAGFVYPISGEGIRPSIASAKAYSDYIVHGTNPLQQLDSIVRWIRLQRRLLDIVRSSTPRRRAEVLLSIPVEDAVDIALGTMSRARLATLAAKVAVKSLRLLFSSHA